MKWIYYAVIGYFLYKLIMDSNFTYTGTNTKKNWYNFIVPKAKIIGLAKGLPWEAIAVQTALETGWGKSALLQKDNNFGGIKFNGSGAPAFAIYPTWEYINGVKTRVNSKFAKWLTPTSGLNGYAEFFHRNKRYKEALKYPNNPYQFIREIKSAGYATDPSYVAKLHKMVDELRSMGY